MKIHNVVVHKFSMGDVDDPDLYAAEPIHKWEKSEQGQWVMKKATEVPIWHRHNDAFAWTVQYAITAKLREKDYSYFLLKWGDV
jgi:hypothetical protein